MNSLTKRRLAPDELEAIVTKAFGGNVSLLSSEELKDGYFSSAYSLSLSNGNNVVLKVAPASNVTQMRYEKNIMQVEVKVMRMVKQHGIIPVPDVYLFDQERTVIDGDYFIMEYLNGQPYNKLKDTLAPERQHAIEHSLGVLHRGFHTIRGEAFGSLIFPDKQSASWHEAFMMMAEDLLLDCVDAAIELPADPAHMLRYFAANKAAMDEVTTPSLVHWDLWNGNVFVDDRTGGITGLIDWERAFWGDPLMEYYFRPFEKPESFLQGYGFRPETDNHWARMRKYDLYLNLILCVEQVFRGYNNPDHHKWAQENLWSFWKQLA